MGLLNYTTAKINELLAKVAALPAKVMDGDTKIPSKTSDLENDSKFVGEDGLKTINGQSLLGTGDITISGSGGGGTADSVDWGNVSNKPSWVNSPTKPEYTAIEVKALPENTAIPSKTSDLENDSKFVREDGLKTVNGQSLLGTGNISISGGGGEGSGGTGNVNVTNTDELKNGKKYVFVPAGDGSTDGTFSELSYATSEKAGLMSAEDYGKLSELKSALIIPAEVLALSKSSSNADIVSAFGGDETKVDSLCYFFSQAKDLAYSKDMGKPYIANCECTLNATFDANASLLEISYIELGGKLKTIRIKVSKSENTYTHTCEVAVSGDDVYYLPGNVAILSSGATHDEIISAAGENCVKEIYEAIKNGKEIWINSTSVSGKTAVSAFSIGNTAYISFFAHELLGRLMQKIITLSSSSEIKVVYPNGYELKSSFYSLQGNPTSDEIKSAINGESGLKKIIKAAKDGNVFFVTGKIDNLQLRTSISINMYLEDTSTGDMSVYFTGTGYALWGGTGGVLVISYTKSTNTFSAIIERL